MTQNEEIFPKIRLFIFYTRLGSLLPITDKIDKIEADKLGEE
jgi:hypothetical protein